MVFFGKIVVIFGVGRFFCQFKSLPLMYFFTCRNSIICIYFLYMGDDKNVEALDTVVATTVDSLVDFQSHEKKTRWICNCK